MSSSLFRKSAPQDEAQEAYDALLEGKQVDYDMSWFKKAAVVNIAKSLDIKTSRLKVDDLWNRIDDIIIGEGEDSEESEDEDYESENDDDDEDYESENDDDDEGKYYNKKELIAKIRRMNIKDVTDEMVEQMFG
jgi:hypothetical protein